MTALAFTVPGPPVPYDRVREYQGRRLIPKRQRAYRKHVILALSNAMLGRRCIEPMRGALVLRLEVFCADLRCGDASNYAKIIEDACNGRAFVDDAQIVDLIVHRRVDRERPRVEVFVGQLDESEDVRVPQSKRRAP